MPRIILAELKSVTLDYGTISHVLVQWEERGKKRSAAINPELWQQFGLTALSKENWYKGNLHARSPALPR